MALSEVPQLGRADRVDLAGHVSARPWGERPGVV